MSSGPISATSMIIEKFEEIGPLYYFYFDSGVCITIERREDDYAGWEYYNDEDDEYAEGGLWFEGNKLMDYDGVCALPEEVYMSLRHMGIETDD